MDGDNVFQYAPNPTGWIDPLGLDARATTDAVDKVGRGLRIGTKVRRGVPGVLWEAVQPTKMGDATYYPTETQLAKAVRVAAKVKTATDNPCASGNCLPKYHRVTSSSQTIADMALQIDLLQKS